MRRDSHSGTMEVVKDEERRNVRILLTFSIDPEKGDQLIKEGRIGETWAPYSKSFSLKQRISQMWKVHEVDS
jgi:hypothetical protein